MKKATIGFIRVRKRKFKRTIAGWKGAGKRVPMSASYDIVRAVRVNGQPRHEFVLGLGSLDNSAGNGLKRAAFWRNAIQRMKDHGIARRERAYYALACVRKGARLPDLQECAYGKPYKSPEDFDADLYGREIAVHRELVALVKAQRKALIAA